MLLRKFNQCVGKGLSSPSYLLILLKTKWWRKLLQKPPLPFALFAFIIVLLWNLIPSLDVALGALLGFLCMLFWMCTILLKLFKPWEYLIDFHWFAGTKPFGAVDCHVMYQINIIENYRYWVYSVNYECSYHPKRWFPFMIRCLDKSRWSCLQCTHHTICQYHDFCILLDEKITLASLMLSWIEFQIVWIFFLLSRSVCNFSRLCC